MADVKLEKFMVIDPKLSEEDKAEVQAAMEKHFIGAG
jgi:hypothetical protein